MEKDKPTWTDEFEGRVESQKTLQRNNKEKEKRVATNGKKEGHLTSVTGR